MILHRLARVTTALALVLLVAGLAVAAATSAAAGSGGGAGHRDGRGCGSAAPAPHVAHPGGRGVIVGATTYRPTLPCRHGEGSGATS